MTPLQRAMIEALKIAGKKWNPQFDVAAFERECVTKLTK